MQRLTHRNVRPCNIRAYSKLICNHCRYWLDLTENDLMWTNADTGWAKAAYSMVFGPWSVGATVFTHNTPQFDPETTLKVGSATTYS